MGFNQGQLGVARELYGVGHEQNAGPKVLKALLESGIVESGLGNPSSGDRDSIGTLQQRPSQGWGTPQQLASTRYQALQFLKRALPIAGKYGSSGALAQAVQRSGFPERYAEHSGEAGQLLQMLSKGGSGPSAGIGGSPGVQRLVGGGEGANGAQAADLALLSKLASSSQQQTPEIGMAPRAAYAATGALPQGYTAPQGLSPAPAPGNAAALQALVNKIGEDSTAQGAHIEQTHAKGEPQAASPQAQSQLSGILTQANRIGNAHVPYLWGGGHAGKVLPTGKVTPLDCSGAVSAALGINPRVSGEFETWGAPGPGKNVSIYASADHVLLSVNGRFWGTSSSNKGGGPGWIKPGVISKAYLKNFVVRHPGNL